MPVTLRDIAKETQLSLATVAKVLGKESGRFRPETRRRVQQVAAELGYRPWKAAMAMRSGKTDTLCLLHSVQSYRSMVMNGLLEGIQDVVNEKRLHLTVAQLADTELGSRQYMPRILTELACDGLLVNYNTQIPAAMIALIDEFRLPAIWINTKRAKNCVYPDDVSAGRLAAEHLLSQGFPDLAFVDLSNGRQPIIGECHYSTIDRYNGVSAVAQAAGATVTRVGEETTTPESQRLRFMVEWLRQVNKPIGLIAYAICEARAIAAACLALNRRLGRDVGLVAIHESPMLDLGFPIDTVVLPERQMGRLGTRMLLDYIQDPLTDQPATMLAPQLVVAGDGAIPPTADPTGLSS